MGRARKVLEAARANPAGIAFSDLQYLTEAAGFRLKRTNGSHHVYTRQGIPEIINIQPKEKSAKAYQVKQVIDLIDKYEITIE